MLKGYPCKVSDYKTSKPGKHGACKAFITGLDIFTNKKHEDSYPTSATIKVPVIKKVEFEVADVNEDDYFVSVIKEDGTLKDDVKLAREDEETFSTLLKMWRERG
jgi:translation initiation factor 5A